MDRLQSIAPLLSTAAGFLFLALGAVAVAAMLLKMGKGDVANPGRYARIHRFAGWSFATLFVCQFGYMLTRVVHYNDEFSSRITIHFTIAIALLCLLALKISVPSFFPNFGKHLFLLGSGVYLLAFPMVLITGGYHVEKLIAHEPYLYHDNFLRNFADDNLGKEYLISKCSTCHLLRDVLKPRSAGAWNEIMDRMVALAMPRISVDEAGQIQSYLEKHFTPSRAKPPAGASLIQEHCLPCHGAEDIFRVPRNSVGWKATVRKMSAYDATIVPPDMVDQLAAFLVEAQGK